MDLTTLSPAQLTVYGSAFCVMLSMHFTLQLLSQHLFYWKNPKEQKAIIIIILMAPIYAIVSFVGILDIRGSKEFFTLLESVKECYEALVIAKFLALMYSYLNISISKNIVPDEIKGREIHHSFPMTLFQPHTVRLNHHTLKLLKYWTWQFVVVRPVCSILMITLQLLGLFPNWLSWVFTIVLNISVSLALYSLVIFYHVFAKELAPHKPLAKFLCIKGIVFFCFWQVARMQQIVDEMSQSLDRRLGKASMHVPESVLVLTDSIDHPIQEQVAFTSDLSAGMNADLESVDLVPDSTDVSKVLTKLAPSLGVMQFSQESPVEEAIVADPVSNVNQAIKEESTSKDLVLESVDEQVDERVEVVPVTPSPKIVLPCPTPRGFDVESVPAVVDEDDIVGLSLLADALHFTIDASLTNTYPYDPGPILSQPLNNFLPMVSQFFAPFEPPPPKPHGRSFPMRTVEIQVTSELTMPPPPLEPPDVNYGGVTTESVSLRMLFDAHHLLDRRPLSGSCSFSLSTGCLQFKHWDPGTNVASLADLITQMDEKDLLSYDALQLGSVKSHTTMVVLGLHFNFVVPWDFTIKTCRDDTSTLNAIPLLLFDLEIQIFWGILITWKCSIEKPRTGLNDLLDMADYVVCSENFPKAWTSLLPRSDRSSTDMLALSLFMDRRNFYGQIELFVKSIDMKFYSNLTPYHSGKQGVWVWKATEANRGSIEVEAFVIKLNWFLEQDLLDEAIVLFEYPAHGHLDTHLLQCIKRYLDLDWYNNMLLATENTNTVAISNYESSSPLLCHNVKTSCILARDDFSANTLCNTPNLVIIVEACIWRKIKEHIPHYKVHSGNNAYHASAWCIAWVCKIVGSISSAQRQDFPPVNHLHFKKWDPGKFIHGENFYNLEDKVDFEGVGNMVMGSGGAISNTVETIGIVLEILDANLLIGCAPMTISVTALRTTKSLCFRQWDPGGYSFVHWNGLLVWMDTLKDAYVTVEVPYNYNLEDKVDFDGGLVLSGLASFGIIQSLHYKLDVEHIEEAMQNILVCIEMVIFSVLQQYAYHASPYSGEVEKMLKQNKKNE